MFWKWGTLRDVFLETQLSRRNVQGPADTFLRVQGSKVLTLFLHYYNVKIINIEFQFSTICKSLQVEIG